MITVLPPLLVPVFLSTPSARRATAEHPSGIRHELYFYPRPPRGGRQRLEPDADAVQYISIHALREEGDTRQWSAYHQKDGFLSTPSARRATSATAAGRSQAGHFYPRPPRGGRRLTRRHPAVSNTFLSTPSARRATVGLSHLRLQRCISIHALREEGDLSSNCPSCQNLDFYPRPPRGGRRTGLRVSDVLELISIHALREEGDEKGQGSTTLVGYFYPRPPRGGRRHARFCVRFAVQISIHALREEGDIES